MFTQTIYR